MSDAQRRVQTLLNDRYIDEHDAVVVLDHYRNRLKWTDRQIVREALIALGKATETMGDWTPSRETTEVSLRGDMVEMLKALKGLAVKLSTMDFSGARTSNGETVSSSDIEQELTDLERSAVKLVGTLHMRDDDDED